MYAYDGYTIVLHATCLRPQVKLIPPLDEASPQTRICTGVAVGALHRYSAPAPGSRCGHPARLQDVFPARKVTPGRNAEPGTRIPGKITERTEENLARSLHLA